MPYFITLEGVEGAGKTTLQNHLAEVVRGEGYEAVLTREPGATEIGRSLRSLVLDPENTSLCPTAELMLFAADRAQHVAQLIEPALQRGAVVICDRHIHSTLAYQGYGRGFDIQTLHQLNALATKNIAPDLVFLLDLDPEIGLSRVRGRMSANPVAGAAPEWTRFEAQELEFHRNVRNGFLELAKDPEFNFCVLDAAKPAEELCSLAAARALEELGKQ